MSETLWHTKDLIAYAQRNYVLEDQLLRETDPKNAQIPLITAKYSRQIRRLIQKELREGIDYTRGERDIFLSEQQARALLRRSDRFHQYFYKEMESIKALPLFQEHFYKETNLLNDTHADRQLRYIGELTGDHLPFNGTVSQDEKMAIFLFNSMFGGSLDGFFDYFGIDGDAFRQGYEDMEKLVDTSSARPYLHADVGADYPMNQEYSFLRYKLERPLIYYRKEH